MMRPSSSKRRFLLGLKGTFSCDPSTFLALFAEGTSSSSGADRFVPVGGGGGVLSTVGGFTFFFGRGSGEGKTSGDSSIEWFGLQNDSVSARSYRAQCYK